MFLRNRTAGARLAAALALLPCLSGAAVALGSGAWIEGLFFPYLWFYLILEDRIRYGSLDDEGVFTLGAAFAFFYEGLWTKRMQDGTAFLGLDWSAILYGVLGWGMTALLLAHCLRVCAPWPGDGAGSRPEPAFGRWNKPLLAVIGAGAGVIYLWKSSFGHYRAEHFLGPLWIVDDILLAAAGVWLWRARKRVAPGAVSRRPRWIFGAAALGLWLLGGSMVSWLCGGFQEPRPILFAAQALWLAGLGLFMWTAWSRARAGAAVVSSSRPMLAAVALRVAGGLLLPGLFGAGGDPRLAFWSGLVSDWPSQMLFFYAFLTSRVEI